MPSWTDEQLSAINKEGTNIIVSAGAGSGKTAVLSERVIRKLKSGVSIDNLLILTFTKAAAHEMKERIRNKIKKEKSLSSELDIIDSAPITTFDSYALSILKKYHYILNVSSSVKVCESSVINLKKEEMIDDIFEELYKEENKKFLKLISDFCTKDDPEIKKYILSINNKLDMKYDKISYLNNYIENNYNSEKIDNDISKYTNILLDKIKEIEKELNIIGKYVDIDYYNKIYNSLINLLQSKTYNQIKNNLDIKMPQLPRGTIEKVKTSKDNITSIIKDLISLTSYEDINEIKESIYSTKDYIEVIIDIILKLDKKINDFKFKYDTYEFNDIAKMAIKIVKENAEIRNELKNHFDEILVDEYQDTNDLQEEFINLISNNNVYMVGDIKQSIYRFRNANPNIFKNKYDKYSTNDNGIKIDLNKNFRSRKETLDNINIIFNIIMDDLIGGADYVTSHQMIFGNMAYEEIGKTNQNNNFEIYNYTYDKDLNYSKEEIEIFITAKDILEKVKNKYQIFDKDNNQKRNIEYKDFVILMDRTTNFDLYKKIFEYLNIPLNVYKDEIINDGIDIYVIRNILKLILKEKNKVYDEEYRYAFMSVARSFLFDYTDDEIFTIIKDNMTSESEILKIIKETIKNIDNSSSRELLNLIIDKFNFYERLIKIGNIEDAMIRIEYLYNLADNLKDMNYNVIDFINYIDEISKRNYEIKYSKNTNDENSVKIMTIHKSKGLEYHVCYYTGLHSKFNISDLKEKFTYDNTYGIITPYYSNGQFNTIYKDLLKDKYMKEEIGEKIRLFYVALTRAKEKMIMITDLSTKDEIDKIDGLIDNSIKLKYTSFLDILKSIKSNLCEYIKDIDINKLNLTKDYNLIKNYNYKDNIPSTNSLVSVSEINIDNNIKEEVKFSKEVHKLIDSKTKNNINLGKNIHYLLEVLDFKNINIDKLNISDFYKNKIKKLLNSKIFNNIENSKIYKEYEFKYEIDDNIYHGVIDLMIENDDEVKIVDYKLKNITDNEYIKQLSGYKKFIENKLNKKVNIYLYSIIEEELVEVKES